MQAPGAENSRVGENPENSSAMVCRQSKFYGDRISFRLFLPRSFDQVCPSWCGTPCSAELMPEKDSGRWEVGYVVSPFLDLP